MSDLLQLKRRLDAALKLIHDLRRTQEEAAPSNTPGAAQPAGLAESLERIGTEIKGTREEIANLEARLAVEAVVEETAAERGERGFSPLETAFFDWVRGKSALGPEARKELVADENSILLPRPTLNKILKALAPLNVIRNLATVSQTESPSELRGRFLNVTSWWGSLETDDLDAQLRESTPVPVQEQIWVEDHNGFALLGRNLKDDTNLNIESALIECFTNAMMGAEDPEFVAGLGHTHKRPEGMLLEAPSLPRVPRVMAAAPGALTFDDVIRAKMALGKVYRRLPTAWLTSDEVWLQLMLIKDKNDQYIYRPGLSENDPDRLLGAPLYSVDGIGPIPAPNASGDVLIFGVFRRLYEIVERRDLKLDRITGTLLLKGKVGYLFTRRLGGGIVDPNAGRVLRIPAA